MPFEPAFEQKTNEEPLFTGLVEELGYVVEVSSAAGRSKSFFISCPRAASDVSLGDSIAINGCCLTVVGIDGPTLLFQAGSETLSRTNLGEIKIGDGVNLERAIRVGDRLGGHYVSGHVDGLGILRHRVDDADWSTFVFTVSPELTRQMASKGSVTVDGVSLTLVNVELDIFSVALIPHTLQVTTLGKRAIGDQVNIETDILAKYVQQQLARQTG